MSIFTDLADRLEQKLDELLKVEVRESTSPFTHDYKENPFENHLYMCFVLPDVDSPLPLSDYVDPTADALARLINSFKIVEAVPPQIPPGPNWGVLFTRRSPRKLPIRIAAQYDMVLQGTRITIDALCRHVGNYYRTIINGPLHRHKMPFAEKPHDGLSFEYIYIATPDDRLNYKYEYESDDVDLDGNPIWVEDFLPGLNLRYVNQQHAHTYVVEDAYCYYTGERLY